MADEGTNKTLLIVIALLLVGILGILVLQSARKSPEEKAADAVAETVEEIGNSIQGR